MWAGGKSKVIKHYMPFMPQPFKTYYEPFFGGGAMFIYIMTHYSPERVVVNDINPDIMRIYSCIKEQYSDFIKHLDVLESKYISLSKSDRRTFYYDIRNQHAWDYQKWNACQESATLYFLMKTGFNGIFQINKNTNNRYGTPCGLLNQIDRVYDRHIVEWWHNALQSTNILSTDWKDAVQDDSDGFFFFDPPYRNSFADYGTSFTDENLLELIEFSKKQKQVFIANRADDEWFEDKCSPLKFHYFDITYTAGRRKQLQDQTYAAKKAREILMYSTTSNTLE